MANALSYGMPQQENPLSPIPSANAFGMKPNVPQTSGNGILPNPQSQPQQSNKLKALQMKKSQMAPPPMPQKQKMLQRPMTSASPNALAMAFGSQQQKPDAMYAFMDTLQRTIDPAAAQARETRLTEQQQQKLGQGLAFIQQMRAIPEDQRMAMAQQGIGQFGLGNIQIPEGGLTDAELDKGIATLSAQLGQGPEKPEGVNLGGGAYAQYSPTGGLKMLREPDQDPTKAANLQTEVGANGNFWTFDPATGTMKDTGVKAPAKDGSEANLDKFQDAQGNWYYVDPETMEKRPVGIQGRVPGSGDGGGQQPPSGYRWNADGSLTAIPGGPADKPAQEYSQSDRTRYTKAGTALGTLKNLTDEYRAVVNKYGPQLLDYQGNQRTERSQELLAAHNNLMMFLKGPELFNLGVLTGPDVERLQRTLPEPVGYGTIGHNKKTLQVGLDSLDSLVGYQLDLIPEEFRPGAKTSPPSGSGPKALTGQQAPGIGGAQKMQARIASQATSIPEDAILEMMQNPTPEEFAQFNEVFGEGAAERILDGQF